MSGFPSVPVHPAKSGHKARLAAFGVSERIQVRQEIAGGLTPPHVVRAIGTVADALAITKRSPACRAGSAG